ncbi:MAG: TerC family protein [Gallionellaceae bacterium]|jgi:YjbE family integral membrane protein|nr:TerC family protein [Gallionellaceae bacterium]
MVEMLNDPVFWTGVFKIIVIDLLLSGDNAVVIALACRNLPVEQRKKGIMFGVAGAIGLRVVLTFFALELLSVPYLRMVGAVLLLWIGIKLLLPEDEAHGESNIKADTHLWGAVKTIIIADFVMSLDNVMAVAGAAHGNVWLLVFGLVVSIPMIAWSSQLILKLLDRFPIIIYFGGGLLGYVAGEMLVSDEKLAPAFAFLPDDMHWLIPAVCALLVVGLGFWLSMRKKVRKVVHLVDEKAAEQNRNQGR